MNHMNIGNGNLAIYEFNLDTIARAVFRLRVQQFFEEWNAGVCFCIN